jgi:hypothetical protein
VWGGGVGEARGVGCVFFFILGFCYSGNRSAFRASSSSYIVRPSSSCLRKTRSLKAQILTSPSVKVCAGVCVCPSESECFFFLFLDGAAGSGGSGEEVCDLD